MGRAIGFASVTLQALHVTIEKQIERSLACAASHFYYRLKVHAITRFPKGQYCVTMVAFYVGQKSKESLTLQSATPLSSPEKTH
jgi:hypothetical protein